jgi:hypothetical protein
MIVSKVAGLIPILIFIFSRRTTAPNLKRLEGSIPFFSIRPHRLFVFDSYFVTTFDETVIGTAKMRYVGHPYDSV